uniref:Uncharacterized protein n=1 Tax=Kalanchoe fedtschenkoi TaxID=63787 RepID=A0A7N0UEW5_KALFE
MTGMAGPNNAYYGLAGLGRITDIDAGSSGNSSCLSLMHNMFHLLDYVWKLIQ